MLADPIVVAANAPNPACSFSATKLDGYGSSRVDTNGAGYDLTISHTPGKSATRHYVKLTQTKDAVNPYTGMTQRTICSVSLSLTAPSFGFTSADQANLWKLLKDVIDDDQVGMARLVQNQS